jgi:excisionase family DNA binding protein
MDHKPLSAKDLRQDYRKLLTAKELSERYNIPLWTIRSYCSQRRIPHIKIGSRVYFRPEGIEAWLEEHSRPAEEVGIP